ncbi:MAG: hypothetical protein JNK49_05110 [Planctomycetes bacterium]|nr:hypothetical protein [Planctomycetota bacterium]
MDEVVAATDAWTPALPWLPGAPPFRLALRPGADLGWREVTSGRFAHSLLAAPADPGDPRGPWSLRLLHDAPEPPVDDLFGAVLHHDALAGGLLAAVVPTRLARPDAPAVAERLPPTVYCAARGVLFRAFCPDTLQPLGTLRDESLLADLGLDSFAGSSVRYEAALPPGGRPRRVYTWSLDGGAGAKDGVQVRRRADLFRDYAELCATAGQRDLDAGQRAWLERELPCWSCPERDACHGSGRSAECLLPLNYHESPAVLETTGDQPFEVLVAILGGAPAASQGPAHGGPGADAVVAALDGPTAWLAPLAGQGAEAGPEWLARWTHEVAYLKLSAFAQLVAQVAEEQRATGRPCLDLGPARVRARFGVGAGAVPARWTGELRLVAHDLPVQAGLDDKAIGAVPPLPVPLPGDEALYRSPRVDPGSFRSVARGSVRVEAAGPDAARVDVTAPHTRFPNVAPGDAVVVAQSRPLAGFGTKHLRGTVEEVAAGRLRVRVPVPFPASQPAEAPAELVTYHRYGTGCDLWALGHLLAQMLVGHDQRDAFAVDEALRGLLALRQRHPGPELGEDALRGWLAKAVPEGSRALLHQAAQRAALPEPPLAEPVWLALWRLVLQLVGPPGGEGAAQHADAAPLAEIGQHVQRLCVRLRVEAFASEAQRHELAAVVGAVLRELGGAVPATTARVGP